MDPIYRRMGPVIAEVSENRSGRLRQHVELYRIYQEKINDCDLQLRKHLESLGAKVDLPTQPIGPRPKGKNKSRNAPAFDLRTECIALPASTGRRSTAWIC